MTSAAAPPSWFTYFPGDYRWSAAIQGMLSTAPWGGAELGEVHRAGRRLAGRVGDDAAWFDEFARLGDEVRRVAQRAERAGHGRSAAAHYRRATSYYQVGERFRTPKDRRALGAYRKGVDAFQRAIALDPSRPIEVVEVPFEGGSLPGYFVPARSSRRERPPAVVFFDGLDITKELQYARGVEEIAARGVSVLVMDGPGTGEAIRFRRQYLRHDYEVAGGAALDYLEGRRDVNAARVGVMAISLGGYYAPRIASMDRRFKACVAWGAIWDYHETWRRRIAAEFQSDLSVPGHHIAWVLGVRTLEEALARLEDFRLDGVVQRMRCPLLITHGERDTQIPLEDARALYRAAGSRDKTLRVFTEAEGGAQHCQRDHLWLGVTTIADWLAEKLRA